MEASPLKLETRTLTSNATLEKAYEDMKQHQFDLENGETMRIVLLVRSSNLHYLIISYHHLNMDGVSFMVLITELAELYAGKKPRPLGLQYPEFSATQRDNGAHGKLADKIAFWRNRYNQMLDPYRYCPCLMP